MAPLQKGFSSLALLLVVALLAALALFAPGIPNSLDWAGVALLGAGVIGNVDRRYLDLSALAAAAEANACTVHLHLDEGGCPIFSIGQSDTEAREFATFNDAMDFLQPATMLPQKRIRYSNNESLCPICSDGPTTFLNVGRDHYAVCHPCGTYSHFGANLFSAWRDESPEVWEKNRQTLAGMSECAPPQNPPITQGEYDSVPF